jgi:hypothetical protein
MIAKILLHRLNTRLLDVISILNVVIVALYVHISSTGKPCGRLTFIGSSSILPFAFTCVRHELPFILGQKPDYLIFALVHETRKQIPAIIVSLVHDPCQNIEA